jgi:predicted transcriptional regulator
MGSKTINLTTAQVAHDILSYLLEHPTAHDTVEGIVEWWLLQQEVQRRTAMIKVALKKLVQQELVLETRGRDGRLHYRFNPSKQTEARHAMASGPLADY